MTPGTHMIAETALYLGQDALSAARTRLADEDEQRALDEIAKALDALTSAQLALRGW